MLVFPKHDMPNFFSRELRKDQLQISSFIELTISFLVRRKRSHNCRLYNNHVKVTGDHVMYTMMQGWYCVESLTGQRQDRVQTESQELQPWTAVSTLLGLVSTVANYEIISWSTDIHIPVNPNGDDLRWNSNPICQLANVTCKTRDKGQ